MKIRVFVKPNSKTESLIENEDGSYTIKAKAPATEGKANKRVIEILAKHFKVAKSRCTLVSGVKSKIKVFRIDI